jgi:putative DNA modification/repair radical SAM protein
MELSDKLKILSAAAKYDVACTSSGTNRKGVDGKLGNATNCGICHSFAADGRCISLLKILFTNDCVYDCKYCVNRMSNDVPRATFTPREIADLTINFYKRNYIEGLFLSSAVFKNPNYTMEQIYTTIKIVREEYHFNGYIHIKAIPGADTAIIYKVGLIVDRMSVNIELPSEESLKLLAPQKSKESILKPMNFITKTIGQSIDEKRHLKNAATFAPAGQSTQLIIGATPDTDMKIIRLSEGLYNSYKLKRVFYSAFVPVSTNPLLPAIIKPPLLREHRLYQADWLLRFYGFKASELLNEKMPNFSLAYDPKCDWAIRNIDNFPVDVNKADYFVLLRVPGIGVRSAKKIIQARMHTTLDFPTLKKLSIVLKRARFFITCKGKYLDTYKITQQSIAANLISDKSIIRDGDRGYLPGDGYSYKQNDLFLTDDMPDAEDMVKCLTGEL